MTEQTTMSFQLAIEELKESLQADFISLALVDLKKNHYELKWRYVAGNRSLRYRRIVLHSGKGVAGIVFKTGKPMKIENVEKFVDEQNLYNYPIVVFEKLKSFGAIPLFRDDHVQGVILIGYREVNRLTSDKFEQFKLAVGPQFGPFHMKERLKDDIIE